MKEQKNIERLFQEKFKDFEVLPPQDSWHIIASRLGEKKKKKRIVPFWIQLSGIAASLFIVVSLIWNFSGESDTTEVPNSDDTVVNTESSKINSNNSDIASPIKEAVVYDSKINEQNIDKKAKNSTNQYNEKSIDEKLVNSKFKNNFSRTNGLVANGKSEKDSHVNTNQKDLSVTKYNLKKQSSTKLKSENSLVTNADKNKAKSELKTNSNRNNSDFENQFDSYIVVDNVKDKSSVKKETVDAFFEKTNATTTKNTKVITDNDSITKQDSKSKVVVLDEIITQDSTLVVKIANEKNPLVELLEAKEAGKNESEKEEKQSKWAISTNASPVYFNSLAEGSSIDEQFNSNSKNYTTTLSYGLTGTYVVNNKLSLRTGVNSINLSYKTNDVVFETRIRGAQDNVPTISRNQNASQMIFSSKINDNEQFFGDVENVVLKNNIGALRQNISYIEVPLELSYKLLDRKFEVELIGGMSTLFLNQNSISLVTNGLEMEVGSANNLNNIHFSSNVGLGFKYSFWKSFNANFQPMFKYQINTFSENSGNFRPYFIGLYTGVGFSF